MGWYSKHIFTTFEQNRDFFNAVTLGVKSFGSGDDDMDKIKYHGNQNL